MINLNGLNCGDHHYRPKCPDCRQIRAWAAAENRNVVGMYPPTRGPADEEHAAAVVEHLLQQEITISRMARWCEHRVAEYAAGRL